MRTTDSTEALTFSGQTRRQHVISFLREGPREDAASRSPALQPRRGSKCLWTESQL